MVAKVWMRASVVAGAAVAACTFSPGSGERPPLIDAAGSAIPDGGQCSAASVECVTGNVLRTCTTAGASYVDQPCTWGCLTAQGPHCGQLVPAGSGGSAGSGVMVEDVNGSGVGDAVITDLLIVNSDTGAIGSNGNLSSLRGSGSGVLAGIDYERRGPIAMFRFKSLTVTGTVYLTGSHPISFVADTLIDIAGTIDARGFCGNPTAGPGGGPGGAKQGFNGSGPGSSGGRAGIANNEGGGGGGNGGIGGDGGGNGGAGGLTFGDDPISLLVGGGGGGGGSGGGNTGSGGGGGGAVQLVANGPITIATGGINAGGCGGQTGSGGNDGGGGGGAGGTILLEATTVVITATLAVNGGGGGAGAAGNHGTALPGALSRSVAAGSASSANASGGDGAAGSNAATKGTSNNGGGGGGGAIGRIRINTRSGSASLGSNAVLSPDFTDPQTTCTQGTPTIR